MSFDSRDGEPCQLHDKTFLKARKEHRCDACKTTIKPGNVYCRLYIICDGESETVVRCGRCECMHKFIHKAHMDRNSDMYPMERLNCGQTWQDEFDGEEPPAEIAAMPFMTDEEASDRLEYLRNQQLKNKRIVRERRRAAGK